MTGRSLALAAAMTASLAAFAPAPAAADDIFTEIFSAIGFSRPDRDPIDYRERAPLVVPPKSELRPPEAPAAQRNAAWPRDPDVLARRRAAAERGGPAPALSGYAAEDPLMSPNALRGGPRTARNAVDTTPRTNENDISNILINPTRQMQALDAQRAASLNNLNPGEEPERKSLAEPPPGYRKPTELVRTQRSASYDPLAENDPARKYMNDQRRGSGN